MTKRIVRTSSDLPVGHWMRRQLPDETPLRPYAEDRAVSILTGAVVDAIENAGMTRAEVARALGTTKSYVSQVLNGTTNMTLKTLGALFWVAGRQVEDVFTAPMGAATEKAVETIYYINKHPTESTTAQTAVTPASTYTRVGISGNFAQALVQ